MELKKQLLRMLRPEIQSKIVVLDGFHVNSLRQIQQGLVSFHAVWSGPSVAMGQSVIQSLNAFDLTHFKLYLVDLDSVDPTELAELIGFQPQGYFESMWVEEGEILERFARGGPAVALKQIQRVLKSKLGLTQTLPRNRR